MSAFQIVLALHQIRASLSSEPLFSVLCQSYKEVSSAVAVFQTHLTNATEFIQMLSQLHKAFQSCCLALSFNMKQLLGVLRRSLERRNKNESEHSVLITFLYMNVSDFLQELTNVCR